MSPLKNSPLLLSAALSAVLLTACGGEPPATTESAPQAQVAPAVQATAPVAAQRPHEVKAPHGATRQDEYYWLRDDTRQDAEMLDYLKAENAYADAMLASQATLRDALYEEMVGRIKQDDSTVPYLEDGYWYYVRYEDGKEYPIHARRRGSMEAAEEVLLDVNQLAEGKGFYQAAGLEVSPDGSKLAFFEDTSGRRQYTLRVKDLGTGAMLSDSVPGLSGSGVWSADGSTIYVVENDPVTLLTTRVKAHRLGAETATDAVVYEEKDPTFYMGLGKTRSEQYICIGVQSTVSSESRCTDAVNPGEFRVIAPRERDFEYSADHLDGRWVIRTNWNAKNFKLMQAEGDAVFDRAQWVDLIPHDEAVLIEAFELFKGFMAIDQRAKGLSSLRIRLADGSEQPVASDESAYTMGLSVNAEPDTDWLRYSYTSMTTPMSTYELNIRTGERKLLKEQPVLGGFDKANYVTERLWAPARDGVQVPVTVLYRKDFQKDGSAALLQYGYGSYGASMDPYFNSSVLSLVDRGMVYAIAHIRGGQEMGRAWYEDGKLLKKMNTFNDFIDVTDYLVKQGYAAPTRVSAMGGSAGGLLMGAVANLAPDKYRAIVAQVPFVDVVTTMLDASIPLTTNEYDEWGNPEDPTYYNYMLSYSPYDNLQAKAYPAMYVGTGLWDSQVQYFEPAKYVARLRAKKTDSNALIFRVNMEAGHGGKSGRFQRLKESAEQYAFLIDQLGVKAN
ncbi:MAG: S9 family peptidase [Lysobacteraceae bacterium]